MADHELERPLSPELVLVSPDLRERALLDEPDVPLPPQADVDPLEADVAPPQEDVAPPTASVPPAPPVPVPPPPPAPPPAQAAGPVARRLTAGTATTIALAALIVFGAGLAVGKFAFPTSTARLPAALRSAAPQAPVTVTVPRASSSASTTVAAEPPRSSAAPRSASPKPRVTVSVPRTSSSGSKTVPARPARSSAAPPRAERPSRTSAAPRGASPQPPATLPLPRTSSSASKTVPARPARSSAAPPRAETPSRTLRPIPNGGYIFSEGTFRTSGTGRTIVSFTLRTGCSGPLTLPPIQVAAIGTFAYSGQPAGALPGTTVHVTGRFVSPAAARGTTRVTRGTCHDSARPFAARLS